jgi:phosphonate degradation associated HDIG domain protein
MIDLLLTVLRERGGGAYFGEAVTEAEHALQCAHLARQAGASDSLIAAALLHDIGHLLHALGEDVAARGIDARHEDAGADWLARHFGLPMSVVEPVRLHVAAKRYLCAIDPAYLAGLSPASVQSLALQGGPFSPEEVREFERLEFWREAVALRRWDDGAKVAGLEVPGLEEYRPLLESLLEAR